MSNWWNNMLYPLIALAIGLAVGFLIERVALKAVRKLALRTRWSGDQVIIDAFRGIVLFWGIAAAAYWTVHFLPLHGQQEQTGDHIVFSAFVLSVAVLLGRIAVGLIRINGGTGSAVRSTSIIANVARIAIYIIGLLVVLQTLGISITPILTALGVGGLAVALALQDTLSNLFAGIQVIASRQVRTGDYVKLESGEEGYVTDITWRNTTIRMLSNNIVVVPNSKIASTILTNYYLPEREMSVLVEVGVSYESDLERVEEVTVQTAKEVIAKTETGLKNFEPFIRYHTFSDSSIGFSVILRASEFTNQYLIKHEFVKALHKAYREHAIEIPFPIRTIHLKTSPQ